jgi:hypothetical protein
VFLTDAGLALSARPACREQSMDALRLTVQTFNAHPAPARRSHGTWRSHPLHRLPEIPGGRYFGQRSDGRISSATGYQN